MARGMHGMRGKPVAGPALASLLVAAAALAGCAGDGAAPPSPLEKELEAGLGGLAGVVIDAGIRPVAGAALRLTGPTGTGLDAVTDAEGAFAFLDLEPGAYALHASADGFLTSQTAYLVDAGAVQEARVVLRADPSPQPYVLTHKKDGYMEAWGGIGQYFVESLVDNGTALCDCRVLFTPAPNATTYVLEAYWDYTLPDPAGMAEFYWVIERQDGTGGDAGYCFSPCVAVLEETVAGLGTEPSYARLDGPDAWTAVGQRFQLFLSEWHHGPAPEGWTVGGA